MSLGTLVAWWLCTDLSCVGGATTIGPMPVITWTMDRAIDGHLVTNRATVVLPLDWDPALRFFVTAKNVVRALYSLQGVQDYREFRIADVDEDSEAGTLTVQLLGIEYDLAEQNNIIGEDAAGVFTTSVTEVATTLTDFLTDRVLPALPSHWAVGTITSAETIDVTLTRATPLAAALAGAAVASEAAGVDYEISARRNGTTGYYIDCTVFNSTATRADLRPAKNLVKVRRSKPVIELTTRADLSDPHCLRRPHYEVATSGVVANTSIDVISALGIGPYPGPAREDDQFNGLYWVEMKNGTAHLITDTVWVDKATTRFLMTSTTTISDGDWGYLARTSGRADLRYINAVIEQTVYGVRLGTLTRAPGFSNLLKNPDLRSWGGSYPDSWSGINTVVQKTAAGEWRHGGVSAESSNAATLSQTRTVHFDVPTTVTYVAWLYSMSSNVTSAIEFWDPDTAAYITYLTGTEADLLPRDVWVRFTRTFNVTTTGNRTIGVKATFGTATTFWFDGAMCVLNPPVGAGTIPDFLRGCDAAGNVAAINNYFDDHANPTETFDISPVDLHLLDPARWPYEPLEVGANIWLNETRLNVQGRELRVVQERRSSQNPALPGLTVSTRRRRLTALLAR